MLMNDPGNIASINSIQNTESYFYKCEKCFVAPKLKIKDPNNPVDVIITCENKGCLHSDVKPIKKLVDFITFESNPKSNAHTCKEKGHLKKVLNEFCLQEHKYICNSCKDNCTKFGHKTINSNEVSNLSKQCMDCGEENPNSVSEFYCQETECNKSICLKCCQKKHKLHNVINLKSLAKQDSELLDFNLNLNRLSQIVIENFDLYKEIKKNLTDKEKAKTLEKIAMKYKGNNDTLKKFFNYLYQFKQTVNFCNYNIINNFRENARLPNIEEQKFKIDSSKSIDQQADDLINMYQTKFIYNPIAEIMAKPVVEPSEDTDDILEKIDLEMKVAVDLENAHEDEINCITIFPDKTMISCSSDGLIKIIDPITKEITNLIEDNNDNEEKKPVFSLCPLDLKNESKILVAACKDSVNVFDVDLQELLTSIELPGARKIVFMEEKKFFVCTDKVSIYLYEFDDTNKKLNKLLTIETSEKQEDTIKNIYYINLFKMLACANKNDVLTFWDISECIKNGNQNVKDPYLKINKDVECNGYNAMCFVRDSSYQPCLVIGSYNGMYLYNLFNLYEGKDENDNEIQSQFDLTPEFDEGLFTPRCFLKEKTGFYFVGNSKGDIKLLDCDSNTIRNSKDDCHKGSINCMVRIDDTHFATCSSDKSIKIWEYKTSITEPEYARIEVIKN